MEKQFVVILAFFISTFCFELPAQSCKEISNWMTMLKIEYPSVQPGRAIPKASLQNMAVNLYSDKHYKSLTGKSFAELSDKDRAKDWRKFQSCAIKDNYNEDPFKNWVYQTIVYNHQIDFRNTFFQEKVRAQNKLREELMESVSLLKSDKLGADQISRLRKDLQGKYAVLFPSEISLAATLLDNQEAQVADSQLNKKVEEAKALGLNPETLAILKDFERTNRQLFITANDTQKTQVRAALDEKIAEVLEVVMKDEATKINRINVENANVKSINEFIINFKKTYYSFMRFDRTAATLALLKERKTAIVKNMMSTIEMALSETFNAEELTRLENIFRKDLIENSSTAKDLDKKLNQRRSYISQEESRTAAVNERKKEEEQRLLLEQIKTIENTTKFNVTGLTYAEFFDNIYRGHFENIEMKSGDEEFYIVFTAYVRAYGRQCDASLPVDTKVEIMDLVCEREETITDIYGNYKRSNCLRYGYTGSGIFARPELYSTQLALAKENAKSFDLWQEFEKLGKPNATGDAVDRLHRLRGLASDLNSIFKTNACSSEAFRVFENNLNRFATGESSIRMAQPSKYALFKKLEAPKAEQNYTKLVNDIVNDLSQHWALNVFIPNSAYEVEAFNNPYSNLLVTIRARYNYRSMGTTHTQYVTIKSKDGIPECVFFADFPQNCKKPSKEILLDYVKGNYNLK